MNKLVIFLMAFYIMALSCVPCQDESLPLFSDQAISVRDSNTDQQKHDIVDLCSPFCICACCSGITLAHYVAFLPEKPSFSFPGEQEFSYSPDSGSGNLTSIWQPPRI